MKNKKDVIKIKGQSQYEGQDQKGGSGAGTGTGNTERATRGSQTFGGLFDFNFQIANNSSDHSSESLRIFLFFVIFAYFINKIMFSLFAIYPIKSSETEISHFIQLIVFMGILFFMTNIPGIYSNGSINTLFWIGTFIGLQFPFISEYLLPYSNLAQNETLMIFMRFAFVIIVSTVILGLIYLNFNESTNNSSYFYVIFALFFIIISIIATRSPVKYFKSQCAFSTYGCCPDGIKLKSFANDTCDEVTNPCATSQYQCCPDGKTTKADAAGTNCPNIYYQTEGQNIKLNVTFILWLLLFLFSFSYSNKIITFIHGLLLGAFISSISFYGMGFLLEKSEYKACNSISECQAENINNSTFMQQYNTDYNKGVLVTLYICIILLIASLIYIIIR
jgi:hypothetical protein